MSPTSLGSSRATSSAVTMRTHGRPWLPRVGEKLGSDGWEHETRKPPILWTCNVVPIRERAVDIAGAGRTGVLATLDSADWLTPRLRLIVCICALCQVRIETECVVKLRSQRHMLLG